MNAQETRSTATTRGPITAILDLFSSVWLGVALMVVIFLYGSLGSAWVPMRESFEKTEMEWFSWWPFNLMIALFCTNLTVVTLRRIPLRVTTAGVWMIHIGILILCGGSVYYFGTKMEGISPVYRRLVTVRTASGVPMTMPALPGKMMTVPTDDGVYRLQVIDSDPNWETRGPDGTTTTSYKVTLAVAAPQITFRRAIVAGPPDTVQDYTPAQRQLLISPPGAKSPTRLRVSNGAETQVEGLGGSYRIRVQSINPNWPLLTGEDRGKSTEAITVSVESPTTVFSRQLLVGYPQYTEDIIPGKGRAIKTIGSKLVDETLKIDLQVQRRTTLTASPLPDDVKIELDFAPQEWVHLNETAAIMIRPVGETKWRERAIEGLPHYGDYVSNLSGVWPPGDTPLAPRPLQISVPAEDPEDPCPKLSIEVTDYLRYAEERQNWVNSNANLNPVAQLLFDGGDGRKQTVDLVAFDLQRQSMEGQVVFRWVHDQDDYAAVHQQLISNGNGSAYLNVEVPDQNISMRSPIPTPTADGAPPPFEEVPGTEFSFRLRRKIDHFSAPNGSVVSVAIVEIKTPQGIINRWVADDPALTRDQGPSDGDAQFVAPDGRVNIFYHPPSMTVPLVTVVAGPSEVGMHVYQRGPTGPVHSKTKVGQRLLLDDKLAMTIQHIYKNAMLEQRPMIEPRKSRNRNAGKLLSMIQVTLRQGAWTQAQWLPFNKYALPNERFAVDNRGLRFEPRGITLPDGREIELMFSRERFRLEHPVALQDFTLLTHQGGLIGNANVRDYISQLRFREGDSWSEPRPMQLNKPAQHRDLWFFQSEWDPPGRDYAGMNYTGCGIANRNGVHIQLLGTCIAVLGMMYAFYLKPFILRRRRQQVYGELAEAQATASPTNGSAPQEGSTAPSPQSHQVSVLKEGDS
jgi:hypothetical protein